MKSLHYPTLFSSALLGVMASSALSPRALAEADNPEQIQTIAFGSCASERKDQPIWEDVLEAQPDIFLFLGDNIYADTEDMDLMREKYAKLGAKAGYQKLLESCPVLATWDDHDFGENDSGAWYPKREESEKIMLDFFDVPENSPRRERPGIYGSWRFGPEGQRVQIILLDARYFKSRPIWDERPEAVKEELNLVGWYVPNDNPYTTILGDAQWKWLEEQLRKPADVRIIGSSIQVIPYEKGMESWGNFPHERKRLFDLIASTGATGTVFLSGDVHFSEISRTTEGPYPFYDFTSSGLTNYKKVWSERVNNFRITKDAYAQPNFGLVSIDWGKETPVITLKAVGVGGEVAFEQQISLSELRP